MILKNMEMLDRP